MRNISSRYFCPVLAICAASFVSRSPYPFVACQDVEGRSQRRLDIAVDDSDPIATATMSVVEPFPSPPVSAIGEADHARITSILTATRDLMDSAKELFEDESTKSQAQEMLEQAKSMFKEAKDHIRGRKMNIHEETSSVNSVSEGGLRGVEDVGSKSMEFDNTKSKYVDHDIRRTRQDEERAMDVARSVYETIITFPECLERLFDDCLAIINRELDEVGLSTIEVVVHEKRNINQDGYNKVVIVTNELADRVVGRSGDGIVSYPFQWNDSIVGARTLGVDGKWNCNGFTPEECCGTIKQSVPNADVRGNLIECHIFVPFGGVGNARRNDRVIINLSPDGRVHEPPVIS